MNRIFFIAILMVSHFALTAQDRFYTKSGTISLSSRSPAENIEASNRSVTCVLDTKTGVVQFAVLLKGFEFRKALMQEHFNEDYVESDKYPKSEFRGQILNNTAIDYTKDGIYPAKVKGMLSIHGESKEVEAEGTITIKGGKVITGSEFKIQLSDYKISIPSLVKDHISETIKIKVDCVLEPLKV